MKTVKRGEKGTWTNVWVDVGKGRGRYALRQGEIRGRSEYPPVMSAITAEEYKSGWRGGDAAKGTYVSGGMLE